MIIQKDDLVVSFNLISDKVEISTNTIQINKNPKNLKTILEWDKDFEFHKEYLPQGTSSIHDSKRAAFNNLYSAWQEYKAYLKSVEVA